MTAATAVTGETTETAEKSVQQAPSRELKDFLRVLAGLRNDTVTAIEGTAISWSV